MYRLKLLLPNKIFFTKNLSLKWCRNIACPSNTTHSKGNPKGVLSGVTRSRHSMQQPSREIHSSVRADKEIGFEEFEGLQKSGVVVIDVRDYKEIKATGTIPGSLNIPLQQLNNALGKSAQEFQAAFGRSKPSESQQLLFLCQRGVRSKAAMERAVKMGYKNSLSFQGGWEMYSRASRRAER
uniref:Rhodanese domain-containing protein n=1 Tax=Graphocephala atropunctata TaxID=36148 RepID=A0A1B6MES4_9HEMI